MEEEEQENDPILAPNPPLAIEDGSVEDAPAAYPQVIDNYWFYSESEEDGEHEPVEMIESDKEDLPLTEVAQPIADPVCSSGPSASSLGGESAEERRAVILAKMELLRPLRIVVWEKILIDASKSVQQIPNLFHKLGS